MDRASLLPVRILSFQPCRELERSILLILYPKFERIVVKIGQRLQNQGQVRIRWGDLLGGCWYGLVSEHPTGRTGFEYAVAYLYARLRQDHWDDAVQNACPFHALLLFQMQELLEIEPFRLHCKRLVGMGNIHPSPLTRHPSTKHGSIHVANGYPL